jgi:hypothetical protein
MGRAYHEAILIGRILTIAMELLKGTEDVVLIFYLEVMMRTTLVVTFIEQRMNCIVIMEIPLLKGNTAPFYGGVRSGYLINPASNLKFTDNSSTETLVQM